MPMKDVVARVVGVSTVFLAFTNPINALSANESSFLSVEGTSLVYDGSQVFLSGANQPWVSYGQDFGNNQSNSIRCELDQCALNVSTAGGNSVRMWVFVEGKSIPEFDSNGNCVGTDATSTLVDDVREYARYAAQENVFLVLCLWNGAVASSDGAVAALVNDDDKLQTFIDNALTPLVTALKDEPGIGAWEIMNEPEGSVAIAEDAEPCFDTKTALADSGAGWSGANLPMKNLLKFHNLQAAAIHAADPKALVTVGSWSTRASTDAKLTQSSNYFNYYKDECLVKAGGVSDGGTLDFYQIHTYPTAWGFASNSPMQLNASDLKLDKPVVIGEFAVTPCTNVECDVETLYHHARNAGYSGVWDWSLLASDTMDNATTALKGIRALQGDPAVQVKLNPSAPPTDTCSCSDTAPDDQYTCAQQALWGKCDQPFMQGYCCRSCHECSGCK